LPAIKKLLLLDPATGQFPLLHNQWFEKVTHKWPRILPDWTGELAVIGSLLSFIWPRLAKRPQLGLTRLVEKARIAPCCALPPNTAATCCSWWWRLPRALP